MNWGHKIVISLIVFAGIMATMVTLAFQENIDLVDFQYYKKEIAFQDQIDKTQNAIAEEALEFQLVEGMLAFKFKEEVESGELHLFRPSNQALDIKMDLSEIDDKQFSLSTSEMANGPWKIKVEWSANGNEYYYEKNIVI